jgi:hypothetical protein
VSYPEEQLQESQYKAFLPGVKMVATVPHKVHHHAVLEIDILSKKIVIYDGFNRNLGVWLEPVFSAVKCCMLLDLDAEHLTVADQLVLMQGSRSRHAWSMWRDMHC